MSIALATMIAARLAEWSQPLPVEAEWPVPGTPYHKPNGGTRSGAAAAKRAARTRRNVRARLSKRGRE